MEVKTMQVDINSSLVDGRYLCKITDRRTGKLLVSGEDRVLEDAEKRALNRLLVSWDQLRAEAVGQ
jgi:hypothetical protein